jgi:hypothetical protein
LRRNEVFPVDQRETTVFEPVNSAAVAVAYKRNAGCGQCHIAERGVRRAFYTIQQYAALKVER